MTDEQEQLIARSGLIDVKDTLSRLGDDRPLFAQVLRWFAADLPMALQNIKTSLAAEDAKATREAVHKLKGSAANAGANRLYKMAATAEQHCKSNELGDVQRQLQEMNSEVNAILEVVRKID